MDENMQGYHKALFVNIYWFGAFFCQSTFTFRNIYSKSSRAWFSGANKNSYRKFLIIEIILRDHIITVTFIYTTVQSTLQTTVYTRPNNLSLVCLYLSLTLYMHNVAEKKMSK
jgi:hypothetical protein